MITSYPELRKSDHDALIKQALDQIYSDFGDRVSVDNRSKHLHKFGRNQAVTNAVTGSTVMELLGSEDHETFVSANDITHFASDDQSDTSIEITVEGFTISGSDLTFVSQAVTTDATDGRTKTALTTPIARAVRLFASGASAPVGSVYVAEDVTFTLGIPQTDSACHLIGSVHASVFQSLKGASALASSEYGIITGVHASVLEKTSSFIDVALQWRIVGEAWRSFPTFGVSSEGGLATYSFKPYSIIPANSDFRVVAVGSASNIDVAAGVDMFLAS